MAKRKRLTPARLSSDFQQGPAPEVKSMPPGMAPGMAPPIAQVSREAASTAALEEVTHQMESARSAGLLLEAVALEQIDANAMIRDRMVLDPEEMQALENSIEARGQQTPIELAPRTPPQPDAPDYVLVSGWRRLKALRNLYERTGEARYATVKARVLPETGLRDAYIAMVEENEIRANLSNFERAHIAASMVQHGIYPTQRQALQGLYGALPRARRSKIGSFIPLVQTFGDLLHHGPAITEKLGLALSKALTQRPGFEEDVTRLISEAAPDRDAPTEIALLQTALDSESKKAETEPHMAPSPARPEAKEPPQKDEVPLSGRVEIRTARAPGGGMRLILEGPAVTGDLKVALARWLEEQTE